MAKPDANKRVPLKLRKKHTRRLGSLNRIRAFWWPNAFIRLTSHYPKPKTVKQFAEQWGDELREHVYRQLTSVYAKSFPQEPIGLKQRAQSLSNYQDALASAKNACLRAAGVAIAAELLRDDPELLEWSGLPRRELSRAFRNQCIYKKLRVVICANWVQCHLWLMTPTARVTFLQHRFKDYLEPQSSPGTGRKKLKGISSDAIEKVVQREKLVPCFDPLIESFTADGNPFVREGCT